MVSSRGHSKGKECRKQFSQAQSTGKVQERSTLWLMKRLSQQWKIAPKTRISLRTLPA